MSNKYLEKIAALAALSTEHLAHRGGQLMNAINAGLHSPPKIGAAVPKVKKILRAGSRESRVQGELSNRAVQAFNKDWSN